MLQDCRRHKKLMSDCDDVKKKFTHTDFWLSDLLICMLFILEYVYICVCVCVWVCAYMLYHSFILVNFTHFRV